MYWSVYLLRTSIPSNYGTPSTGMLKLVDNRRTLSDIISIFSTKWQPNVCRDINIWTLHMRVWSKCKFTTLEYICPRKQPHEIVEKQIVDWTPTKIHSVVALTILIQLNRFESNLLGYTRIKEICVLYSWRGQNSGADGFTCEHLSTMAN